MKRNIDIDRLLKIVAISGLAAFIFLLAFNALESVGLAVLLMILVVIGCCEYIALDYRYPETSSIFLGWFMAMILLLGTVMLEDILGGFAGFVPVLVTAGALVLRYFKVPKDKRACI